MTVHQIGTRQTAFHSARLASERGAAEKRAFAPSQPSNLSSFEFVTSAVPRIRQFEAWRANFAPIFDIGSERDTTSGFIGRQVTWDLGCFMFSHITTDPLQFRSVTRHLHWEPLDHFVLSVLLSGEAYTQTPASKFRCTAGVTQVHAMGRSFHGSLTASELLMLFVPRDFCPRVSQALSAAEFTTLEGGMARLFHDYMAGLANQLPFVQQADLPALVEATRAMILACVSPSADNALTASHPIAVTLLDRAQKIIQSRLFDPSLGAETLERELGVSRSRLYRMFEPFGGVKHYIQHRRLLDAHAALANPSDQRRILDLAEQRCFSDGTEFSRAFKREFGYSPTDVRIGRRSNFPCRQAPALEESDPAARLGTMLRRLHG
ncbi:AraC-like DNA-binding protein [Rhizobium sp. BK650]|uniref:helix-turn-helix domain-containing protein n=1 Tax=Rhizobium sp. BK650 TaxID=2586990 RepID=UPI001615D3B0|nr:helix-turn-helix domain-containing protein [Rhizobium sp. BK650]MBB3659228.1 AraC-like DNA-binding protein [Rhizobium sp. BK650]